MILLFHDHSDCQTENGFRVVEDRRSQTLKQRDQLGSSGSRLGEKSWHIRLGNDSEDGESKRVGRHCSDIQKGRDEQEEIGKGEMCKNMEAGHSSGNLIFFQRHR